MEVGIGKVGLGGTDGVNIFMLTSTGPFDMALATVGSKSECGC
jgi:hypothetical protein